MLVTVAATAAPAPGSAPQAQVEKAARAWVQARVAAMGVDGARVEASMLPAARRMPECHVALAMQVADVKDGERFDRLQVVARCPETGTEGRFTVRASAGVAGVVAREELLAGEPLQPSALQMAEQDLAALPDLLLSPEEARGFSSRRTLRPGQPLRRSLLQGGSAVGRGQPVRIVAGGRGFQVAIAGTALEDGAVGEVVRIRNASTGRPARATVLGPGVVSLEAQP